MLPVKASVSGPAATSPVRPANVASALAPIDAKPAPKTPGRTLDLSKVDVSRIAERQRQRKLQDFAKIVGLMTHEPKYQDMTLKDLRWLVMPAVSSGQYALAETKAAAGKTATPVAALLWAQVSPEIDKKIVAAAEAPLKLQPTEWTSGKLRRVVAVIGRKDAVASLSEQFQQQSRDGYSPTSAKGTTSAKE